MTLPFNLGDDIFSYTHILRDGKLGVNERSLSDERSCMRISC